MSGIEHSRRTVLGWGTLATGTAALVHHGSAVPQPSPLRTGGSGNPRDHGAVGDGQYRALGTVFPTLAAAQARFPFVTSLRQSVDWAGIQAALDAVEGIGGRVLLPVGRYIITDSLRLPNECTLEGESRRGSIIDNQNLPLNAPQLVNKQPSSFLYVTLRNLTLNGGTHALRVHVDREAAGCVIEGITAELQSEANIEFNSIQTTVFRDCHLVNGRFGIKVTAFPCNSVHLFNTRLGGHDDASLSLRGADLVVMAGGSIEAGGRSGPATIDLGPGVTYAHAIAFRHVFFENTHRTLLRSRGVQPISFDGCKFSGTGAGTRDGFSAYTFDCGNDLIEFGSNHWDQETVGPANCMITGRNDRLRPGGIQWLTRSGGSVELLSAAKPLSSAAQLVEIKRPVGDAVRAGPVVAEVHLHVVGRDEAELPATRVQRWSIRLDPSPGAATWLSATATGELDASRDVDLAVVPTRTGAVLEARKVPASTFAAEAVQLRLRASDPAAAAAFAEIVSV